MALPSRDELRERLASLYEAAGVAATDAYSRLRRIFEERPLLGRVVGSGAAVLVLAGVVIGVVAGQSGPQTSSAGQLVVPAVTPTPRADEQHGLPTVGAPPHPGTPPEPEQASRRPHAAPPTSLSTAVAHPDAAAPLPGAAAASPSISGQAAPAAPHTEATASATAAPHPRAAPHLPLGAAVPHPPERATAPTEHRVRRGETLAVLALRYGVPFEQIASDSGLANPNRLRPGQRLVIGAKPAGVEVIQPGRTLGDYARSTGRRLDELMRLNPQLVDPDRILAGGRLDV